MVRWLGGGPDASGPLKFSSTAVPCGCALLPQRCIHFFSDRHLAVPLVPVGGILLIVQRAALTTKISGSSGKTIVSHDSSVILVVFEVTLGIWTVECKAVKGRSDLRCCRVSLLRNIACKGRWLF